MAIPSSELVLITPRVLAGASNNLEFNGLFLTESTIAPVNTLLEFYTAAEVANYFGYDSSEYRCAISYFNGYENSLKKPSLLYFFRHISHDVCAYLRGGRVDSESDLLTDLRNINNGSLSLIIGGEELALSNINLSQATSLSDAAQIIQDAIRDAGLIPNLNAWKNAEVEYSSLTKAFTLTSGVAGAEYGITYATGNLADLMLLTEGAGAIISDGATAYTFTQTLDAVCEKTGNFVTYSTSWEVTSMDDAAALAEWSNNQYNAGNQFLYIFYTTDASLDSTSTSLSNSKLGYSKVGRATVANVNAGRDIAEMFLDKGYEGVAGVYGSIEYAAFFMGMAACVEWNKPNTTITFAFKRQSGLSANVSSLATAKTLEQLKLNFIGDYASRNDTFVLSMHGAMYGAFAWMDTYINSIWLNNALQVALLDMLAASGRIPYNESGMALLSAACQSVISKAIQNGVIETGVTISDMQKTQLMNEAGLDISQNLINNGYFLQIKTPDAEARQQRTSPICNFWYTFGGAVHKLNMPVTTVS